MSVLEQLESCVPYPSEEVMELLGSDAIVRSAITWRVSDQYVDDPEVWRYKLESLTDRLEAQHGLPKTEAQVALACYEDRLKQDAEITRYDLIPQACRGIVEQIGRIRRGN